MGSRRPAHPPLQLAQVPPSTTLNALCPGSPPGPFPQSKHDSGPQGTLISCEGGALTPRAHTCPTLRRSWLWAGPQGHCSCEKLFLKALLVFPFIKQSEKINQKSIYRRHTASNNRFEWPVRLCDYFIFHANLNTRKKGFPAQGPLHGREIECICNNS